MTLIRFLFVTLFLGSASLSSDSFAQSSLTVNFGEIGRSRFQAKRYDEAITALRQYLKRSPRDWGMWNLLGVSYYHTGQPRKALRYLKHVERKTTEKSYNYYYQGLSYIAAEMPDNAREYFAFIASRYTDEYTSRATFELAVLEYKLRNTQRATYWLGRYLQLFPSGVHAPLAQQMVISLREFRWIEGVEGAAAPNQEDALFKYNALSLSTNRHFWFFQTGGLYKSRSSYQPTETAALKPSQEDVEAFNMDAGIGIGPTKTGDLTTFAGYTYRQRWYTEMSRIDTFFGDPFDFQYFPLRTDLMERKHQFYADMRRGFGNWLYLGVFGRYEFSRAGSSILPSVENDGLNKVTNIATNQLLIPWVGFNITPEIRGEFFLYWFKQLNESTPDFSNKTYDLGLNGQQPLFSFGSTLSAGFPEYDLNLGLYLFHYDFIYNDPWLDYTRQGAIASAEHEFVPRWFAAASLGFYTDKYIYGRIKKNGCNDAPTKTPSGEAKVPSVCNREDTGLLYQASVYWNYTQFHRFTFQVQTVENSNSSQKEFQDSSLNFIFNFTMAFPSVKRVSRIVDRFADSAFTKEPQ